MRFSSFRLKLLAAIMLVVGGVTAATLLVVQARFTRSYQAILEKQFERELESLSRAQDLRLANTKKRALQLAGSIRILAALEAGDAENAYSVVLDELQLRDLGASGSAEDVANAPFTFLRLMKSNGRILSTENPAVRMISAGESERLDGPLQRIAMSMPAGQAQQVDYLPLRVRGKTEVQELVLTRIVDQESGKDLGALILGFPLGFDRNTGLWMGGRLYAPSLGDLACGSLDGQIESGIAESPAGGSFETDFNGSRWRVFFRPLQKSGGDQVEQVIVYQLDEAMAQKRAIQSSVVLLGALSLLTAFPLSWVLARGLSGPIRALVLGTTRIQRGDFDYRVPVAGHDEIGLLARSFNEMASDLALKERYRSVLNMVADEAVAHELVTGRVALGGEVRDISVLFCDIRGFTRLSEAKGPAILEILNEHMTAMTEIVHRHHGVVDKFVGDLIMAIFGAPKSYGDDAYNAAACALEMAAVRERMNETAGERIEIGIGIASGPVIAGCTGSSNRLDYTVIGERVNLASRLCGKAERSQIFMDDVTAQRLAGRSRVEPLGKLDLKGISSEAEAFMLLGLDGAEPWSA